MTSPTRFAQLARALPLHAQRIAEAVHEWDPRHGGAFLQSAPEEHENAGWTLCDAFDWKKTPEGYDYWDALARRGGWLS